MPLGSGTLLAYLIPNFCAHVPVRTRNCRQVSFAARGLEPDRRGQSDHNPRVTVDSSSVRLAMHSQVRHVFSVFCQICVKVIGSLYAGNCTTGCVVGRQRPSKALSRLSHYGKNRGLQRSNGLPIFAPWNFRALTAVHATGRARAGAVVE